MLIHVSNSLLFAYLRVGTSPVPVRMSHVWRVNAYAFAGLLNGATACMGTAGVWRLINTALPIPALVNLLLVLIWAWCGGVWFFAWLATWWGIAIEQYFRGVSSTLNWAWFVVFLAVAAGLVTLCTYLAHSFA